MSGRFIRRAETVARPVGVKPKIGTPTQRKWSRHRWRRGWNKATLRPLVGSTADRRASFRKEHETQARARLSARVGPCAAFGTMWSTWKLASWPSCDIHSIRIEHPHAAKPSGAIERERHSLPLRPPIADSFDPQPQKRKQLSQIHQALCLLPLRCS
jgi:hypothetical protein